MAKKANIKLKPGATPITVSGKASGGGGVLMRFPTEERQVAGWYSEEAKVIVKNYADTYELIDGGCRNC